MDFNIKDNTQLIMHADKTLAVTKMSNLELRSYIRVDYENFVDSMAWKSLKKHADYSMTGMRRAKKILEGFNFKLHECDILYHAVENPADRLPLIIGFDDNAILIAPKIEREEWQK